MKRSTIDFIKEEMQKSGFQLEDKVASLFSEFENCEVEQNYHFTDWQTGSLRELDLKVEFEVTPYPIQVKYTFLIECKRIHGHAWVFIRNRGHNLVFKEVTSLWDNYGRLGHQNAVVKIIKPIFKIEKFTSDTFSKRPKEVVLDKKKSNNKTDNIFASSIKLAKVLGYEKRREHKIEQYLKQSSSKSIESINIYYPMIIFEGEMYEATMLPNLEIKPISSAHLEHFSIQNNEEVSIIIDVVKADALKEFIEKKLLPEVAQIKKNVAKVKDSYLSKIEKLKNAKRHVLEHF